MLNYPSFDRLKQIYPNVGVKVLKPAFQSEGSVSGNMLIGAQIHSEYKFVGKDFDELYYKILKAQHFIYQKTGVSVITGEKPVTKAITVSDDVEDKTGTKVWVVSDTLVERYRVNIADLQSYLDRGFVAYRKSFAPWVDKKKIAAWTEACKLRAAENLKNLAKPSVPGVDLRVGSKLLFNAKTNERKRFPKHEIEQKLAEGWTYSDLTAQRLKNVKVGAGRGAHFIGGKRMIRIKDSKTKNVPAKDVEHFLKDGWKLVEKKAPAVQKAPGAVDGRGHALKNTKWIINNTSRAKQRLSAEEAAKLVEAGLHSYCGARTK